MVNTYTYLSLYTYIYIYIYTYVYMYCVNIIYMYTCYYYCLLCHACVSVSIS